MTAVPARRTAVPSPILGMVIFVITEVMMFAGLISAFVIARQGSPIEWPPPWQPRLPVVITSFNTCVLLASGSSYLGQLSQVGQRAAIFRVVTPQLLDRDCPWCGVSARAGR